MSSWCARKYHKYLYDLVCSLARVALFMHFLTPAIPQKQHNVSGLLRKFQTSIELDLKRHRDHGTTGGLVDTTSTSTSSTGHPIVDVHEIVARAHRKSRGRIEVWINKACISIVAMRAELACGCGT